MVKEQEQAVEEKPKRRRGRPPGSTNSNSWKPFEQVVCTLSEAEKNEIIEHAREIDLLYVPKHYKK